MDFDKEMEKKFDELFWYVLNEQTHQTKQGKRVYGTQQNLPRDNWYK